MENHKVGKQQLHLDNNSNYEIGGISEPKTSEYGIFDRIFTVTDAFNWTK